MINYTGCDYDGAAREAAHDERWNAEERAALAKVADMSGAPFGTGRTFRADGLRFLMHYSDTGVNVGLCR